VEKIAVMPDWVDWVIVGLLGALVGVGGIVSRYRDDPGKVLTTVPAIAYILLNLTVSVIALLLARGLGWTFGATADSVRWAQVLVAGVGGTVLIRASFFTVKVGDEEVQVGPNSLLQSIFGAIDRHVDRLQAETRAAKVGRIMTGVSFEKAKIALPAYCFALMQNLPSEDQQKFSEVAQAIDGTLADDQIKALLLGAQLMNLVGDEVLAAAVKALDQHIKPSNIAGAD
jgi:hypothetical protein